MSESQQLKKFDIEKLRRSKFYKVATWIDSIYIGFFIVITAPFYLMSIVLTRLRDCIRYIGRLLYKPMRLNRVQIFRRLCIKYNIDVFQDDERGD